MVRFEQHTKKKYRSQMFAYFFLLILILIFIGTIGVNLLINTSLFIVKLTQKDEKTQTKTNLTDVVLPPEIFDLPEATNSATVVIQGRASGQKKLAFYVNDTLQKQLTPDQDAFETELELEKGENTIYLMIEDSDGKNKKQSKPYTIVYKDEKPSLEISSPHDQDKISKDEVQVVGQTDTEVVVKINDLPVVVDTEGKFTYILKLQEGENKIRVEAKDIADNTESKELTVFYRKEE